MHNTNRNPHYHDGFAVAMLIVCSIIFAYGVVEAFLKGLIP